jgi:hypothetical protein
MLCCESSALRCVFALNIEMLYDDDTGGGSEICYLGIYVRYTLRRRYQMLGIEPLQRGDSLTCCCG